MKNKQCLPAIKELLTDVYLCVLDDKCDIDDLMKNVIKALDFFKGYCCSIEDTIVVPTTTPTTNTTAGRMQVKVAFTDDSIKILNDLNKSSTVNKIVLSINNSITEYLKKNSSANLLDNCHKYLQGIESQKSSIRYNYNRLRQLIFIMQEMISYDVTTNNSFNWAATSFIFHIVYTNITGVLVHMNSITNCIQNHSHNNVETLSKLFESKKTFIDLFLVNILPKILAFNINVSNNNIYFNDVKLQDTVYKPILCMLADYNKGSLDSMTVKLFLVNHGHSLLQAISNPIKSLIGGNPNDNPISHSSHSSHSASTSDLSGGISLSGLSKGLSSSKGLSGLLSNSSGSGSSINLNQLVDLGKNILGTNAAATAATAANAAPAASNTAKTTQPPPIINKMPDDKDYKKIVMLKFFTLLEKCVQAYKEKKDQPASMVINIFEGTRGITIKDGQVLVKDK